MATVVIFAIGNTPSLQPVVHFRGQALNYKNTDKLPELEGIVQPEELAAHSWSLWILGHLRVAENLVRSKLQGAVNN